MVLRQWFAAIFSKRYQDPEEHTFAIQKWITHTTFLVFIGLVIYSFWSVDHSNFSEVKELVAVFLAVLTAWMGAIVAFYFSKELANLLTKRLSSLQRER